MTSISESSTGASVFFWTHVEIYISLSSLLLPETINGLSVSLMCLFYKRSTKGIRRKLHPYRRPRMYLLHYSALFLKHSTESTHSSLPPESGDFLFNLSYFITVSASFSVLSALISQSIAVICPTSTPSVLSFEKRIKTLNVGKPLNLCK